MSSAGLPGSGRLLLETPRFRVEEVASTGRDGQIRSRAVVRHPGAVTILPLLEAGNVCLIRNRRVAVGKQLIELPAGTLEPGELPIQTAARELIEETGYQAGELSPLGEFYLSPGILDERMYLFLARNLTSVGANREAGEEIENMPVSWRRAMELVESGAIEDAKTIVGLLRYDRIRRNNLA